MVITAHVPLESVDTTELIETDTVVDARAATLCDGDGGWKGKESVGLCVSQKELGVPQNIDEESVCEKAAALFFSSCFASSWPKGPRG